MKIKVPVELTPAEKLLIGDQLSKAQRDLEAVEAEKREANQGLNARIKGYRGRLHELSVQWETGRGEREEDVEEQPAADGKTIIQTRIADGVKVGERPITDADRQLYLSLGGAKAAINSAADKTEEQGAATPEEAEEMRVKRLVEEHNERWAAAKAEFEAAIIVTPQEAGGFLAAAPAIEGVIDLREIGATEDEAKLRLVEAFAVKWLESNSPPVIEAPPEETAEERARRDEIAALAKDQIADEAKDGKAERIAKGGGLKAPKKKSKKMTVEGQDGKVIDLDAARSSAEIVDDMVRAVMLNAVVTGEPGEIKIAAQFITRKDDVDGPLMVVEADGDSERDATFALKTKLTEFAAEQLAAGSKIVPRPPGAPATDTQPQPAA
jgi:predicted RNase H-like HicB family nuclease